MAIEKQELLEPTTGHIAWKQEVARVRWGRATKVAERAGAALADCGESFNRLVPVLAAFVAAEVETAESPLDKSAR